MQETTLGLASIALHSEEAPPRPWLRVGFALSLGTRKDDIYPFMCVGLGILLTKADKEKEKVQV